MLAFILSSIISTVSSTNCQYFEFYGYGPAMPCGVCLKAKFQGSPEFSYEFECGSSSYVTGWAYQDGSCRSGIGTSDFNAMVNTNGGVCNHVTFRSYAANYIDTQHGKSCVKDEDIGYFDVAFVAGCWKSLYAPQFSFDLSCTDDSFDIAMYGSPDCNGDVMNNNATTIYPGCQNSTNTFNASFINDLFPNLNLSSYFHENETYFDITECGGGDEWPLWATIAIVSGSIVCYCLCCGAALAWFVCRRRKGGIVNNGQYIETYGYETNK